MIFVGPARRRSRRWATRPSRARRPMRAGVPTVPGSDGVVTGSRRLRGCRGHRLSGDDQGSGRRRRPGHPRRRRRSALQQQMAMAQAEAKAAFGNGAVYMERFIRRARHIEVQILGDGRASFTASSANARCSGGGRRCWEEAPSPAHRPPPAKRCAIGVQAGRASRPTAAPARWNICTTTMRQRVLLHRDEHPHPGRAPGDRDGDRRSTW